jgi:hypothetical protein
MKKVQGRRYKLNRNNKKLPEQKPNIDHEKKVKMDDLGI